MTKRRVILILLLILALGAFFRFYSLTSIPPGLYPDEAANGNNALEALATKDFKVFYPENNGREGLFINLQAAALKFFGNEPWTLRVVSALFGTLTILGIYLLTKELLLKSNFNSLNSYRSSTSIALLASFFLATSFWHINFSRIGFRAVMVPFFATFGLYFLLRGLRTGKIRDTAAASIFTALGFYTYIAFRFIPFVLAVPLIIYLVRWWKNKERNCIPCIIVLFLLLNAAVGLPLALHFFENPQDFLGRAGDVSVFSATSSALEFIKSNVKTLGMFFVQGDCNWRHNYGCLPELNPFLMVFFLVGTLVSLRFALRDLSFATLFAWLFFTSLPATLTREGMPHALRSIGMVTPVMILSGWGAWWLVNKILNWFESQKTKWPQRANQLLRIKKEIVLLFILILFLIPVSTYRLYFVRWANAPQTYFAFSTDLWHLGQYLNQLPQKTKKYVVVNLPGVDIRGIPAPAQTVMFATDTFRESERTKKNIYYITADNLSQIRVSAEEKVIIAFLNGVEKELIKNVQEKSKGLKIRVPGDFVVLQNY